MSRYQILKKQSNIKPIAYIFRSSNSINIVCSYIRVCLKDRVSFDASNISSAVLDPALIKISRELSIPIVTESQDTARVLSMLHRIRVYSVEDIPEGVGEVISYWDVKTRPKNMIVMKVLRK